MQVQPYINFDGRCEEAISLYRRVLNAEVLALLRFKDNPEAGQNENCPPMPAGSENKVMHAQLKIGSTTFMASDCHNQGKPNFQGFSLSLTVATVDDANRIFAALSDGGQVLMPLDRTFFSPRFGVVADKFGLSWMIYVAPPEAK